jgi:hypothetical protein
LVGKHPPVVEPLACRPRCAVKAGLYRPKDRGWLKVKNPNYWRLDLEREAMRYRHERQVARTH